MRDTKESGRGNRGKKRNRVLFLAKAGMLALVILAAALVLRRCGAREVGRFHYGPRQTEVMADQPQIDVQLLEVNPYSRPGDATKKIQGIVIHYTANPGSSAQANRDYFNGLKDSHKTEASSNFIIGLEGEIIQCVPTWEVAYASNKRNIDTVSIECCHPDESGWFNDATYESLVQLTAWLCVKFDLSAEDVIRHYDVTGKNCPKYFVENEDAWEEFLGNVEKALQRTEESSGGTG